MDTADELLIDTMSVSENSEGYYAENLFTSLEEKTQPTYNYSEIYTNMRHAMEICDEQQARGDIRFVELCIESNASNQTLVEEVQQLYSRQNVPLTWAR